MLINDGQFRKASGSNIAGCVEVASITGGSVLVRNSRDREGKVLEYTDSEWRTFIQAAKLGEFDLPDMRGA